MSFKVVDLFCGCGGLSLGFERAGFDVVGAADAWDAALAVHARNLAHKIRSMDLSDVEATVGYLMKSNPDIVIGGPPCQDFSIAGNRDESAGRASLTLSFANAVCRVRPRAFVMENVYVALKTDTYAEAFACFRDSGYGITAMVLDASRCGCPQARRRCFTIGFLDGTDDELAESLRSHLAEKQMTVRDYFGDSLGFEHYFVMPRSYARRGIFSVDEPAATVRGMSRPMPATYRRHPRDTCEPELAHVLTIAERGWFQTFPKWFEFFGSKSDVAQMIGNAVPVNMARYVASILMARLCELDGLDFDDARISEVIGSTFTKDSVRDTVMMLH